MSKGSLRLLTSDEIALAKSIFRNLVIYSRVWIHHGSYLPFNLQGKNTAMSPNEEIYFKDWYCDDFSGKSFQYQYILYMRWRMFGNFNVVSGLERGGWQVDLLAMNID